MGVGLAVVASRGIVLQERIVDASRGGLLTEWDVEAMAEGFVALAKERERLADRQAAARTYAQAELSPAANLDVLLAVLGSAERSRPVDPRAEAYDVGLR